MSAIKQHGAGCFYLPGASLTVWDKVHHFVRACDGIIKRAEGARKPFIYELMFNGQFKVVTIP
jgi:hypothetical protein